MLVQSFPSSDDRSQQQQSICEVQARQQLLICKEHVITRTTCLRNAREECSTCGEVMRNHFHPRISYLVRLFDRMG